MELVREGAPITFKDDQRGSESRAMLLHQPNEGVIDRFVSHAVDEQVGTFLDRSARRLKLGRVHRDTEFAGVTLRDGRVNDRAEERGACDVALPGCGRCAWRRGGSRRRNDIPNLDVVRIMSGEPADELPALLGWLDFHGWPRARVAR